MKRLYSVFSLFLACCLSTSLLPAQEYPSVNVHDIMTLPADTINAGSLRSPMLGDTVWLTGVVTVPTLVNPLNDRRPVLWASRRWVSFLRDVNLSLKEYAGVNILQADTSDQTNTLFDRVKPGDVIKTLVKISNFPSGVLGSTQVEIIPSSQIEFVDEVPAPVVAPIPVSISDFNTGPVASQTTNFATGSKYVGTLVELHDVTVVSATTFDYVIADANGNEMYVRTQSGYYTKASDPGTSGKPVLDPNFEGFTIGQTFTKVRGYITSSNIPGGVASFMLTPVYPDDTELSSEVPAEITEVSRDLTKPFPSPDDNVPVKIYVQKGSADITTVKIVYTVNGGNDQNAFAVLDGDFYLAAIPPQDANALVRYKAIVTDATDKNYTYPLTGDFAYRVLDRAARIPDVREQLFASGSSAYRGFTVTVSGVVTATATDIPRDGTNDAPRIYIQDGTSPYSGMMLQTTSPEQPLRTVARGTVVRVTGTVDELFGSYTALTNITDVQTIAQGVNVEPVKVTTASFSGKQRGTPEAEKWENMLVQFTDVTVVSTNADGPASNFGEFVISENPDATTGLRVETDDSNINITNHDVAEKLQVTLGMKFGYLRGIMYYSFGNYKLVPRGDQDYELVTSVDYMPVPARDMRAFPNPFSTETTVELMVDTFVPTAHISVVNMLGVTLYTATERNLAPGAYRFTLNGALLPTGTYTCTVDTGNGIVATHLVVVK